MRRKAEQHAEIGGAHIQKPEDAIRFMFAGNATFTIKSKRTNAHFTYRVREWTSGRSQQQGFSVFVLTGASNESDFSYIGSMRGIATGFYPTAKSRFPMTAPCVRGFKWFSENLRIANRVRNDQMELWHEGKCGRCGRKLTVPSSIHTGLGPDCAEAMGVTMRAERVAAPQLDLRDEADEEFELRAARKPRPMMADNEIF